ncbi:MAG: ParA family protein [Hyphomicrobium sp.]|uniref:ParA family protein n=1 Tax=Hyphomicrobium sp. TaxID=82 RepID=UPI003D0F5EAB
MGDLIGELVEGILKSFSPDGALDLGKLVGGILIALIAVGIGKAARWAWPRLLSLYGSIRNIERARRAVAPPSRGIWLAPSIPLEPPSNYKARMRTSIPIIVVANLKGGVGKTTTAANLVAHYAIKKGEKVLAIDLDFQGSLTATAMSKEDRSQTLENEIEGGISKAAHLIDDKNGYWLRSTAERIAGVTGATIVPTYYSLASTENRVMVEWLIGRRTDDVRYHLATVLHDEEVQSRYQRVIIDAPPRLTTACVQALAACTHVLIPTVLDELSAEAVGAFADQLRINQEIWPHLRIVGVVGAMTENSTVKDGLLKDDPLKDYEGLALSNIRDTLRAAVETARPPLNDASVLPIECFIPNKTELGRLAGYGIAYANTGRTAVLAEIKECFDRLGDEIDRRVAASRSGSG